VSGSRLAAAASSLAFAALCATLAGVGRIPWTEAGWAAAAVALAFAPTGWWAPVGWRRRAAEAMLAFPAWALVMTASPAQRQMLLPPLLAAAGWAALAAAWPRLPERRRTAALVLLALAARAAGRLGGRDLGIAAGLLAAAVPFQALPVVGAAVLVVSLIAGPFGDPFVRGGHGRGRLPGLAGPALVALCLAPWGGIAPGQLFPSAGGWTIAALAVALVVTRWLPPGVAGAAWLAVALTVGPALAPTPDRRGFILGDELSAVDLPAGSGAPYVLDIGLDGVRELPEGTPVAVLQVGDASRELVFPDDAALRIAGDPGRGLVVWRPRGAGGVTGWYAAARSVLDVAPGVAPRLARHPDLPSRVNVRVETEGPALPTAPRSRTLGWWLTAAAIAVAALQALSGTWRGAVAGVGWTILIAGSLLVRAPVEPLRLLAERHGPDLALAALLAAWLPAAVTWLEGRRVGLTVAALLVPLALATPALTPPLHGDEPFHLAVLASLTGDRDLDLANNLDLERHPQEAGYVRDGDLLHSPALGLLLLPGFVIAGRTGALVILALVGAWAVTLLARRARRLGVPTARLGLLVPVVAATYPLAIFASQTWVELVGVLAVAAILVAAAGGRGGRWAAVAWAVVATAVKTRLGLLVFPPALAAWAGVRRGRTAGALVLGLAAVASLSVGWLTMGHPFGVYRRLADLAPSDPGLALRVVGGLVFDPAGGLAFAAPLWLVALAGMAALWRRGGPGERMLLAGCAATALALLHSVEWYGGGSPPARYLVPMLPAFALAGGLLLREPRRWRRAAELLLLPSLAVWWVLVTRPHLSVNPGDGGWWATDALARSYLADTAWLAPSFLVPRTATWVVPLAVVAAVVLVWIATRWRPGFARRLAAAGTALWLLGAAALVAAVELRTDRVVEAEAPQVRRHGGEPVPPPGTFSRFSHRGGWRLADGEGVTVPLNLGAEAEVWIEGWLLGTAQRGATLEVRWDDGEPARLRVWGEGRDGRRRVPDPPGAGRHRLRIDVRSRPHGAVVLDRVVVEGHE
jgi:hypothetical protein